MFRLPFWYFQPRRTRRPLPNPYGRRQLWIGMECLRELFALPATARTRLRRVLHRLPNRVMGVVVRFGRLPRWARSLLRHLPPVPRELLLPPAPTGDALDSDSWPGLSDSDSSSDLEECWSSDSS